MGAKVLMCVGVGVLCAHGAGPAAAEESELERALGEARVSMEKRAWDKAEQALIRAVGEHAEHPDCIEAHWTEIYDSLARAAFWASYDVPEAEDAIAGELVSWNARSGKIKLRYRAGDGGLDAGTGDFFQSGSAFFHPMLFKGPYSVELRGNEVGRELPVVLVGFDWDTAYGVGFGHTTVAVEFQWGDDQEVMDSCTTGIKSDEPYVFEVKLAKTSLQALYNGKRLLKVKRKGDFGQFGFTGLANVEEVVIVGEVEPSWIAGKLDAVVQADWLAFRDAFDPFAVLPAGISRRVRGTFERTSDGLFGAAPIAVAESATGSEQKLSAALAAMEKIRGYLDENEMGKALKYAERLESKGGLAAAALDWIFVILNLYQGDIPTALARCERVAEAAPGFVEGRILLARLSSIELGREAAIEQLDTLSEEFPEYADIWIELGQRRLFVGDAEGARAVYMRALEAGLPPEALRDLELTRLCALRGPTFGEASVRESKHFRVVSDMGEKACFAFAEELEKFHLKYTNHVWRLPSADKRRFPVFIFSGLAGYESYGADLYGSEPENELGQFNPATKQLLIWNSPDRRMMMRTIRHEGFHQYFDRVTSEAPVWLNEGMAEYFEQAELVRGRWKDDQVNDQHVMLLSRADWTPFAEFIRQEHYGFRSNSSVHYAEGWALVHYLFNGPSKRRSIIKTLIEQLATGASRTEALDAAFEGVDLVELEGEVREHLGF